MKSRVSLVLVPLWALGCGSSPAAPTASTTIAPRPLTVLRVVEPSGANGFTPPTSVTIQVSALPGTPTQVESASFRMLDAKSQALVEAVAVSGAPNPEQSVSAGRVAQTLRWPSERGVGSRIDVTLSYRDAAGVLASHSFSIDAR